MSVPASRYPDKTRLRHHVGSVWEVARSETNGDYMVRCVVGTVREGWIGGEVEGSMRWVHADYLHGDGWTRQNPESVQKGDPNGR